MTEEQELLLLVVVYILGTAFRILWPYALALIQEGESFDYRYVTGQILASVVSLVTMGLFIDKEFLAGLELMGYAAAFIAGFGASSIGRNGQKTTDYLRNGR